MKMKKLIFIISIVLTSFLFNNYNLFDNKPATGKISFYKVPLVCVADATIGCGSRIKPLFIETAKQKEIKESWSNRQGTVIAFVWTDGKSNSEVVEKLFKKFDIDGSLINDEKEIRILTADMDGKQSWYQGMAVDSLSLHEAGTIAFKTTKLIADAGLITSDEVRVIKPEIENYFKKELVKLRTFEELCQDEKTKWLEGSYQIYASHIGIERAEKVKSFYLEYLKKKESDDKCKKSCDDKKGCCIKK